MDKDEALKMAIEFIEMHLTTNDRTFIERQATLEACKEALEQPTVAELNDEYLRDTNVIGLEQQAQEPLTRAQQVIRANNTAQPTQEPVATIQQFERKWIDKEALEQPAEPRLVSYALDGSTCTLNIDGEEVYFNREQSAQEPVELDEALKHCNGKDCNCYAYYQGECACDADWTPEEVIRLRYQLKNTHPHQWQKLTDDEIEVIDADCWIYPADGSEIFNHYKFARAVLAKAKEKNYYGPT